MRTHLNFPASNKEAPSVSSQKSPASNMSIPTVLVGAVALILTIALTVLFLGHISDVIRCKNKIKQAEIVLGQAEEEMHTASQHGFRLDKAAGPLRDICSEVTLAKTYLAQKNYRSAEMLAEQIISKAEEARGLIWEVCAMPVKLSRMLGGLEIRRQTLEGRIPEIRATYERMMNRYAESSVQSVHGNGRVAGNLIFRSQKLGEETLLLVSMQRQDWDQAGENVAQITGWLNEAETRLSSVIERE